MNRYLYLVFLFILVNVDAAPAPQSAKPVKHSAILKIDSSVINERAFNKNKLSAYSKQPEFQYKEIAAEPSLWVRFWRWFWHLFDFLHFKIKPSSGFWQLGLMFFEYLFVLAGLGALVFFILKMAGIDMFNIFRRKPRAVDLPYSELLENIHEINFDSEIENAVSQHNYRLAVRLLYLKCLKQLNDASLIKWQPEKTNSAYINELDNTSQHINFKLLTRQFEYVWYGDFPIDGSLFKQINFMFQNFKNEIA